MAGSAQVPRVCRGSSASGLHPRLGRRRTLAQVFGGPFCMAGMMASDQSVNVGPLGGRMHIHEHTTATRSIADFNTETEWAEWVRDYYRDIETYDWVDVADHLRGPEALFHRNRRRTVRRLLSRYRAQTPMLDAGCGTGLNLASLPEGSVGIDLNPRNLELIRARLPEHQAVEGDIEAMPFGDESFATVVCTEVLEHVPHPEAALREIRRVLQPGGLLVGSVPCRSLIWRLRF